MLFTAVNNIGILYLQYKYIHTFFVTATNESLRITHAYNLDLEPSIKVYEINEPLISAINDLENNFSLFCHSCIVPNSYFTNYIINPWIVSELAVYPRQQTSIAVQWRTKPCTY